jgi:alanyl-tRNA synthetase
MSNDSHFLYYEDPFRLDFETTVIENLRLPDGRLGVILERSYFYPTGGGQEHDTGTLGKAQVLDVFKQEDPVRVVHVIDRPLPLGQAWAKINPERRQRHMQHHTAQHLLTQCFVHLFGLDTLSANINGYNPSTLDLQVLNLLPEQLTQAENLANQFIYENRTVWSYFVTPGQLAELPLRRAPKVSENIRIVEIDGFDYTPCGGTHCSATGQIGVIKIVKTEKQNERTRVHFAAGWQAVELFQASYETVSSLAAGLSVGQRDLVETVLRLNEQLQKTQKDLQALQFERLGWEAGRLAAAAEIIHGRRVVLAVFAGRPTIELRTLGGELVRQPDLISVLAAVDGQKLTLLAACGEVTDMAARDLLAKLLAPFKGRGGGDARLAQGGGSVGESGEVGSVLRKILEALFSM